MANTDRNSVTPQAEYVTETIFTKDTFSPQPFLVNDQRDTQIPFYVFIFIYNSLLVSSTQCSSSGEKNCVNTNSGNRHSVLLAVSYALDTATNTGNQQTNPTKPVYSHPAHDTATNTE
jgi:hypothetical protein